MKTIRDTTVAVLPIGEFDSDLVKKEFEAILRGFNHPATNIIFTEAVCDEENTRQSIQDLSEKNFDLLLIIILQGLSARTIEAAALVSHAPILIWPVQGRYALPSSALAVGALQELKVPVELDYIPPDNPESLEKIQLILKTTRAYSHIRQSRIGIIGGLFPNLVSCRNDPHTVQARLGTTLVPISYNDIRDAIRSISLHAPEINRLRQEIARMSLGVGVDENGLQAGLKLHLALKQFALDQQIDGFAVECWSGFPRELGLNPCLGFIEDAYILACEGDIMLCVSLLMVQYLTGSRTYAGDLYDLDMDGNLTLTHCGAPASLVSDKSEVVLGRSQLALERGFDTVTCRPPLTPGTVTLIRFYGGECDHFHMAMGELLSSELSPNLTVKIKLTGNRQNFLDQCFGNHYLMVSKDIRPELRLLGNWMDITIHET